VLGTLRPKVDPKILAKIEQQEAEARAAAGSSQAGSGNSLPGVSSFFGGQGRVLPKVITDPIAPSAEEVARQSGPIVTSANNNASPDPTAAAAEMASAASSSIAAATSGAVPQQPQVATYGASYGTVPPPPPGALGGGLIPPPPAVTLSTQAQAMAYAPGSPNPAAANPYANPYNNPYMNPYGMQYPPQGFIPSAPMPVQRPAGSPFSTAGSSSRNSNNDDSDDTAKPKKSTANFMPITPTGMEARSPYKQRDDLKILWKGFLATSPDIKSIVKDEKIADQLNKIDVGLPGDSTKGSFEVSQRQVDNIFKAGSLDKRLLPTVKKLQKDLVQSYMRYLYSYNKFALAQQTVTARKQEVDVAGSPSEAQRAAADLSQSQTDADSTRDDMKAAQSELVSTVGPAAARTIIGHVSSVTPTLESLTQNSDQSSDESGKNSKGGVDVISSVGSLFGFHHKKEDAEKSGDSDDDSDKKAAPAKAEKQGKNDKTAKGNKDSKDSKDKDKADKSIKVAKGDKGDKADKSKVKESKAEAKKEKGKDKDKDVKVADKKKDAGDLSPAPESVASKSSGGGSDAPATSKSDISFVLREVSVTPRKSVLTVSIHNSGSNSFSFGPDAVSISDGTHKLSDAAVRADFDQTLVPPNQDVKGTITIFGRPYNDKLAVVLSDGGKSVQMRRQN
jgi:hypothetical protein